jgi:hypothetical protein
MAGGASDADRLRLRRSRAGEASTSGSTRAGARLAPDGARPVLHSGRRTVLRLASGMLWAATFLAVYQRQRLFTSNA